METIVNEITGFDVYESSKKYVRTNVNRQSNRTINYWKAPVQSYEPIVFKVFNPKEQNRLKKTKALLTGYNTYRDNGLNEGERILPLQKIELKENIFFISKELKEIAEEIKFSEELLNFDEDSLYEKTLPINTELYYVAIKFLIQYSEFILKNLRITIQAPEINAGRNNNVYLSWRTANARLAISIENKNNSEIIANYYGDLGSDNEPIKGNVSVGKISEYLAYWMKYLA